MKRPDEREDRFKSGNEAEDAVVAWFEKTNQSFSRTGWEHNKDSHNNTPDFEVYEDGHFILLEVKADDGISEASYEHCLQLAAEGRKVYVLTPISKLSNVWKKIDIRNLKFFPGGKFGVLIGQGGSRQNWQKFDVTASVGDVIDMDGAK